MFPFPRNTYHQCYFVPLASKHMSVVLCVSLVVEHISLVIPYPGNSYHLWYVFPYPGNIYQWWYVFPYPETGSAGDMCSPTTEHISLVLYVPLPSKHISLVICIPPTKEMHITSDMCSPTYFNKTRFERNSFLEYYHMTCIGKRKHTS